MADTEFTFESKQFTDLLKKINKKWDDIADRKEFGGIISATVYKDLMDHFDKESGPEGKWQGWSKLYEKHLQMMGRKKKWRGWSELYGKHIQMMGRGGNKKLQFSGRLRQTITPESWRSNAVGILFYDNAKTKKGFPYAEAHDQGGSMNGRPPKRSFMWLSNTGMDGIVDKVNRWLSED